MPNKWSIFNRIPSNCFLCEQSVPFEQLFCAGCTDRLPFTGPGCARCGIPLARQHEALCGRCLSNPPAFERTLSLYRYRPPIDFVVQQFKFHEKLYLGHWLGRKLGEKARQCYEKSPQLLVPVPLHPERIRERGFNQALELAKSIARETSIPVAPRLCRRIQYTAPQSSLPESERARNLRGAFHIDTTLNGEHIALVDDVMTTGTTLNELAGVLKKAGASRIDAWVIARTAR